MPITTGDDYDQPMGGPKEDALAVFDRFLTAFTAADVDAVVGEFWPDTLFWGTTKPALITTPEGVQEYFRPVRGLKPNECRAASLEASALVGSDSVVLISGYGRLRMLSMTSRRSRPYG